jgi:hypothetical protein
VGSPRFWYIIRTSELIQTSAAGQITAINGAVITVSSLPSTIVTGVTVDACGDQPPFNILGTEEVTDVSGTDVTLENAVTGLAVGDWLALEGQTPIPQIPVEFRLILAQRIVCKIYELQGYLDKLAAAQKKLKEYEDDLTDLITPRVSTKSKVINPVNGGFLSGNQNKITNFPAARNV